MTAISLWSWLRGRAEPRLPASASRAAAPFAPAAARPAAAAHPRAGGDAAEGEEFRPGVWARAAAGIYT